MEFVLSYFEYLFYTTTLVQSTSNELLERRQQARSEQAKTGDQPLTTEIFAQLVTNCHSGTVLLV